MAPLPRHRWRWKRLCVSGREREGVRESEETKKRDGRCVCRAGPGAGWSDQAPAFFALPCVALVWDPILGAWLGRHGLLLCVKAREKERTRAVWPMGLLSLSPPGPRTRRAATAASKRARMKRGMTAEWIQAAGGAKCGAVVGAAPKRKMKYSLRKRKNLIPQFVSRGNAHHRPHNSTHTHTPDHNHGARPGHQGGRRAAR